MTGRDTEVLQGLSSYSFALTYRNDRSLDIDSSMTEHLGVSRCRVCQIARIAGV